MVSDERFIRKNVGNIEAREPIRYLSFSLFLSIYLSFSIPTPFQHPNQFNDFDLNDIYRERILEERRNDFLGYHQEDVLVRSSL